MGSNPTAGSILTNRKPTVYESLVFLLQKIHHTFITLFRYFVDRMDLIDKMDLKSKAVHVVHGVHEVH